MKKTFLLFSCLFLSCGGEFKDKISELEIENKKLKDSIKNLNDSELLSHKFYFKIDTLSNKNSSIKLKIHGRLYKYTEIAPLKITYLINGTEKVLINNLDVTEFHSEIDNLKLTDSLNFRINSLDGNIFFRAIYE